MRQPDYQRGGVRLWNCDCLDLLPQFDPDSVEAVVTDPPYGIRHATANTGNGICRRNTGTILGDDVPFDPNPLLRFENVLMWGANHYAKRLPDYGRWLAWDKLDGRDIRDSFSDVEFAWHSIGKASRLFRYLWKGSMTVNVGENNGRRDHPTQKPVGLMLWCLEQAAVSHGGVVLDPFMGSGSTGIACIRTGRQFLGIEKSHYHFDTACHRIDAELDRLALFDPVAPAMRQGSLQLEAAQ